MSSKDTKKALLRINTLLKGIDNSVVVINKHKDLLKDSVTEVKHLISGVVNNVEEPNKIQEKVVKIQEKVVKEPKKVTKESKKVQEKVVKESKKVQEKVGITVEEKSIKPAGERPLLKVAIKSILDCPLTTSEIYKKITTKWGYWSKQSLYNALKDEKLFVRNGDKFTIIGHDDSEAERLITKVQSIRAISNVR